MTIKSCWKQVSTRPTDHGNTRCDFVEKSKNWKFGARDFILAQISDFSDFHRLWSIFFKNMKKSQKFNSYIFLYLSKAAENKCLLGRTTTLTRLAILSTEVENRISPKMASWVSDPAATWFCLHFYPFYLHNMIFFVGLKREKTRACGGAQARQPRVR